jgi:hypothetical protein
MDRLADRYMKNSPVHGWTWPMFVLSLNIMIIDSLFNFKIYGGKNMNYLWVALTCLVVFNFFVFTYKNRHAAIIEECSRLPYWMRRLGVTFFAVYSIVSLVGLLVVVFAGWKIVL